MRNSFVFPFMIWILTSLTIFSLLPVPPLWAADPPSQSPCDSFGIQRFSANTPAPPFTLKTLDDKIASLSDYRGKPLLIFFWGTWCEACKEDLVLIEKFANQVKDQVTVITIVVDGERKRRVQWTVRKLHLTLPVLLLLKENVIDTYEVRMIPLAIFIDSYGHLLGKVIGQRDWTAPDALAATKELFGLH